MARSRSIRPEQFSNKPSLTLMMKSSIFTIFLSLIIGSTLTHGATINVGVGESIQTAVDTASSGDTIVLTEPADYDGNVTIAGKALRIVSLHRNNHA